MEPWMKGHEEHAIAGVSLSWGEFVECQHCEQTLAVFGPEDNLLWQAGDGIALLRHYLRDHDFYEQAS